MLKSLFAALTVVFFVQVNVLAQTYAFNKDACEPTTNKEALKLYKKAEKEKEAGEKRQLLNDAVGIEPNFHEALFELGEKYFRIGKTKLAKDRLEQVRDICPEYSAYTWYMLGMIAYEEKVYKDAQKYLEKFITYEDIADKEYGVAKEILPEIKGYADVFSNPVPFNPVAVNGVSTEKDEYLGSLSPDNRYFYFIRKTLLPKPLDARPDSPVPFAELFTQSINNGGKFDGGEEMGKPFNMKHNNGAASITADNKHMYFVICENNQVEFCDLWYSDFVKGQWTTLRNMGSPVNSGSWDSQPTVSYDGKTLIFTSNRPGGLGETDLYMSTKREDGSWTMPVNMGPTINTAAAELTPFLHSDSETLYFSSKGHGGVGGYDIFFSKKNDKGEWAKPQNIGYPINSEADDVSFFVSLDGATGYYSSDRLKGPGGLDIYSFELHPKARPTEVLFVEGTVKTSDNKMIATQLELKNTRTKEVTKIDVDSTDGKYVAVVTSKDDYVMTIKEEGIAFTSTLVSKESVTPGKPVGVNLVASKIKEGEAYRLNDINFATNSFVLSDKAKFIIEEFADFLKKNPTITIAIQGHTDNVGNDNENLLLSDNRAKAVQAFLVELGIDGGRMSATGYGETRPVGSNESEAGRLKNRRTEFMIVSK